MRGRQAASRRRGRTAWCRLTHSCGRSWNHLDFNTTTAPPPPLNHEPSITPSDYISILPSRIGATFPCDCCYCLPQRPTIHLQPSTFNPHPVTPLGPQSQCFFLTVTNAPIVSTLCNPPRSKGRYGRQAPPNASRHGMCRRCARCHALSTSAAVAATCIDMPSARTCRNYYRLCLNNSGLWPDVSPQAGKAGLALPQRRACWYGVSLGPSGRPHLQRQRDARAVRRQWRRRQAARRRRRPCTPNGGWAANW